MAVDSLELNRMPKIKPADSLSVSICERVRLLDYKLHSVEIELSANVTRIINLIEKVNAPTTYASLTTRNITMEAPVTRNLHHVSGLYRPSDTDIESSVAASSGVINMAKHNPVIGATKGFTRLKRGESTTLLVFNASSKPSGYNEGFRYQGKQRKNTS